MPQPGASLLSYRASIPLSNHTLVRLAELTRIQRAERGCQWRRLDPAQQALLVLAHLRNGDTYTRLAAGFSIGTTTAWRYVRDSVDLLAALADDVDAAVARAARLAYAILDGTLIPIDRLADERPYYSGKHKQHGVNVQLLADPAGRLVWASPVAGHRSRRDRRSEDRPDRRLDRCWREDLCGQGLSRRGRHDPDAVQAASPPSMAVTLAAGRQPLACPHPRHRRACRRDLEGLEGAH